MKTLILASQSPRRFEILKNEKIFFVPFPVYVSEIPDKNLSLNEQIIDIATRKGKACLAQYPETLDHRLILSADTMVCIDNQAIGKPEDDADAFRTLKKLSGRTHQVKTALYLYDKNSNTEVTHIETTDVEFKSLNDQVIQDYLTTGEHADKAGSYGLQGLGRAFVKKMTGDRNNVIGLPLESLKKILIEKNWPVKYVD
jgi:septum formation protein